MFFFNRKLFFCNSMRMSEGKSLLRLRKGIPQLHYSEFQQLLEYQWPGNIRELENFIEQLVNLDGKFSFDYFKQQMSGHAHTQVIADDEDVVVERLFARQPASVEENRSWRGKKSANRGTNRRAFGTTRTDL
jgi:transcriptional regulator with PAS, ATPase and Fis domain